MSDGRAAPRRRSRRTPPGDVRARRRALVVLLAAAALLTLALHAPTRRALGVALFLPDLVPAVTARPLRLVTAAPTREAVRFGPPERGWEGSLFVPAGPGPRPALVVALGIAPAGPDDPRVVELADGLARQGFATLVPYSPNLVAGRLTPDEIPFLVAAHRALAARSEVDATRVGFFGVCVGASLSLLAAAEPALADEVAMVGWFGGYARLDALVAEVSAGAYRDGERVVPWPPDPLAREVVGRLLEQLGDEPAARALAAEPAPTLAEAEALVARLPLRVRADMARLSPLERAADVRAPVYLMDDPSDALVPYRHTRRMRDALGSRVARHATFDSFRHMDLSEPASAGALARDLGRLHGHVAAMLGAVAEPGGGRR